MVSGRISDKRPPPGQRRTRYDSVVNDERDARDGLTRLERVILWQLRETTKQRNGGNVATAMLYGRVVEHVNVSVEEFQTTLQRLMGMVGGKR